MIRTIFICLVSLVALSATAQNSSVELLLKVNSSGGIKIEDKEKIEYPVFSSEKGLLDAYSKVWSDEDYPFMYHLLSSSAKEEWTFSKFKRLLLEDKATTGGLLEFDRQKETRNNGSERRWSMVLIYKRASARAKSVQAILIKEMGAWFVKEGGLLPPDYSMFDR